MIGTDRCYVCGSTQTEVHHIYYGKNRKASDRAGFTVRLCPEHHRGTNGVHGINGHELDQRLKQEQQAAFEADHSRQEFINIIGRNYLE